MQEDAAKLSVFKNDWNWQSPAGVSQLERTECSTDQIDAAVKVLAGAAS